LKRALDVAIASIALVFVSPLFLAIAVLIRLESEGPVFFRQERHGKGMRPFRIYKFRTMFVMESVGVVVQATRGDARITRVGRFLRRSSLDELPQLINVLRGEMSIVGPRPHALSHDRLFSTSVPAYTLRFRSRPGMTGLAQLKGARGEVRSDSDIARRAQLDLEYHRRWSIWLDLWLIASTPARLVIHLVRDQAFLIAAAVLLAASVSPDAVAFAL
jgi:lipopolysaccharide/colanic/teichoic acid biosynthesis glycosyltransferase